MRRGMLAGATGWGVFACVCWMWNSGASPRAQQVETARPARAAALEFDGMAPAGSVVLQRGHQAVASRTPAAGVHVAPRATHEFVLVSPGHVASEAAAPAKVRMRVTLETLSLAAAMSDLEPGEDMAQVIQQAAATAGRPQWFTADWDKDGVLTGADVAAYAAAFKARSMSADLNHDGRLDGADFVEFLREFNERESRPVVMARAGSARRAS